MYQFRMRPAVKHFLLREKNHLPKICRALVLFTATTSAILVLSLFVLTQELLSTVQYEAQLADNNIISTQAQRLYWLNKACSERPESQKWPTRRSPYLKHLLVDDKHKVMYCYVPKVGCSTWRKVLLDVHNGQDVPLESIHSTYQRSRYGIRNLQSYSMGEIVIRLQTYYKFMFVRHPLTRLVSAYIEKISEQINNNTYTPVYAALHQEILKHAGKFDPKSGSNTTATFSDFASFVFTVPHRHIDMHWETIENLCMPCRVKYDFIGEMRTFHRDSKYILSTVLNKQHSLPHLGRLTFTTQAVARQYLSTLPRELCMKVLDFYSRDARLFNYNLDSFSCSS